MTAAKLNQLYRYALSLTNDEANAFDLVHATLEKCLKKKPLLDVSISYIRTAMRNLFIDQCRRNKIVVFEPLEEEFPVLLVDSLLESMMIDSQLIAKLMDNLAVAEREVLFLWAVEEYTAQEIANELQCSRNTVLSRLHRVKKKARLIIENITHSNISAVYKP